MEQENVTAMGERGWYEADPRQPADDIARRYAEHDAGGHYEDPDVDCPACRAEAESLGMGELLPAGRQMTPVEAIGMSSFENGYEAAKADIRQIVEQAFRTMTNRGQRLYSEEPAQPVTPAEHNAGGYRVGIQEGASVIGGLVARIDRLDAKDGAS